MNPKSETERIGAPVSTPRTVVHAAGWVVFFAPALAAIVSSWRSAAPGSAPAGALLWVATLVWLRAGRAPSRRWPTRLGVAALFLFAASVPAWPSAFALVPDAWRSRLAGLGPLPSPGTAGIFVLAGACALTALALVLLVRHQARVAAGGDAAAALRARAARLALWAPAGLLAAALATALGFDVAARALGALLAAAALLLAVEIAARGLLGAERPADSVFLRVVASRTDPFRSVLSILAEVFDVDLGSAFALRVAERALLPIALGLVVALWLSSALVMVGVREAVVVERFGRLRTQEPLAPGLHVKLPWPIETAHRVGTHEVRTFTIGYEGQVQGASMLWTVSHSAKEHLLLLGDGQDLISINAILAYRLADAKAALYATQDPEPTLRALADRVVLQTIVSRTLDEVLSENLAALADAMERRIQEECDARGLGIEIVDLLLVGLHPPIAVAPDYQSVIGAEIEKRALETAALAYREETVPAAHAEAATAIADAESYRASRLATARGEAEAFRALERSYAAAPQLYLFRRKLETLEKQLGTRHVHVLDDRIERDGGSIWILD